MHLQLMCISVDKTENLHLQIIQIKVIPLFTSVVVIGLFINNVL
ncbi:MAG: hypothetical protein JWQ09_2937 [Segetibacter sp.]|nr:hypothetical protein [Segetibacter sp.]